jgi:hypothetical protein
MVLEAREHEVSETEKHTQELHSGGGVGLNMKWRVKPSSMSRNSTTGGGTGNRQGLQHMHAKGRRETEGNKRGIVPMALKTPHTPEDAERVTKTTKKNCGQFNPTVQSSGRGVGFLEP